MRKWHTGAADLPMRRQILDKVMALLVSKKGPKATQNWLNKLRPTACQLEQRLYDAAGSKVEYTDSDSLTSRLKIIVKEMSCKHADTTQNEPNMQNVSNNSHTKKKLPPEEAFASPERLVKQQHMLFLVLHGQFCRCPPHKCQVTPLCAKIKSLWAHAKDCKKGSSCANPYCAAARGVFSHFKTCPNRRQCKLCGPVLNATIRHNTIQQNLDSSFVSQTLRKCHFNMKRERLEKMEEVMNPTYKSKRICCA